MVGASIDARGSTSTSQGASLGAVVGGLAGGGVGVMADTAEDKKRAREQKEREIWAMERSTISGNPQTAYRPPANNRLVGSTWRVISYVSDYEPDFDFKSMVVTGRDYVMNAEYSITGRQMIVVSPVIRIVLEEVEDTV